MTAMGRTIAAVLMALCIPAAGEAADLPQTIQTQDGFTISLPADWVSFPKEALDNFSETLAKLAPKADRQTYAYGFQLPMKKHWFEYPYVLVQIKRGGRISEAQLKSVKRVEQDVKQGVAKAQGSYSALISSAQVGEAVYEPAAHILWIRIASDVQKVGAVRGLSATVLTEEGMIMINGYALAADFDQYAPVFEAIARSAVVADNLKYRPRFTDSLPLSGRINWGIVLRAALIGAVAGLLPIAIIFIPKLRRKKKTGAGPENGSGFSS